MKKQHNKKYDLQKGFELLCEKKGGSISSIATGAGLDDSTIRKAIKNNNITIETLEKIAEYTGHFYTCPTTKITVPSVKKLLVTMGIK